MVHETSFRELTELLGYWSEEPPTHVLLALRYLGERKKKPAQTDEKFAQDGLELQRMLGTAAKPMPPHVREMAEWAEAQQAKLRRSSGRV